MKLLNNIIIKKLINKIIKYLIWRVKIPIITLSAVIIWTMNAIVYKTFLTDILIIIRKSSSWALTNTHTHSFIYQAWYHESSGMIAATSDFIHMVFSFNILLMRIVAPSGNNTITFFMMPSTFHFGIWHWFHLHFERDGARIAIIMEIYQLLIFIAK